MEELITMAVSPESISLRDNTVDFRAPPPSPVASGRRSCVTNNDDLSEFLETSLHVPDLVLPDKIFPKQRFIDNPARIDFESLAVGSGELDPVVARMVESISRVGCFQLVNFGIPTEVLIAVMDAAGGIFRLPPEKRALVVRSPERRFGFEEVHGEEESELVDEFVWFRDGGLKSEMEKIWPLGYSNFREKIIDLIIDIENVAEKLFLVLWESFLIKLYAVRPEDLHHGTEDVGPVCCLFKHRFGVPTDRLANSLRYDVIRMLIQANDYSHVLGVHVFDGCNEFHVYSKKGWVTFPEKGSVIVTVGDQFQGRCVNCNVFRTELIIDPKKILVGWFINSTKTLSGGQYKHVVGRPVFKEEEDHISMAFLYAPPQTPRVSARGNQHRGNVISIGQQATVAVIFTLLYQLLFYIYKNF